MARIINVCVNGEFVEKDSKFGGVQGEGNTTTLHLTFDASWDGYGKRVVWRNAKGEDPVAVVLTQSAASMAEPDYNQRVYDTPIPTEPMKLPGWCTFTIEGYKAETPGAIALTVCDALEVQANDSFYAPAEPTPSQAQQLLGSIEQIKPDMEAFAKESKSWAVGGTGSRDGEDTDNSKYYSQQSKESSEESARQAVLAENSKEEATRQAGLAAASAVAADSSAQESKNHADEAAEEVSKASDQAKLSRSWAVGGTGSREGEDSNNAKYWASVAEGIAGGGVSTFNGRSGAVLPMKGDYTPEMVGAASLGPDGKVPTDQLPEMDYDPAGTADRAISVHNTSGTAHSDIRNALSGHIGNKSNPHGVTAAHVGAYTKEQVMASTIPAMFGLGAGAVPSDVLAKLGTYKQHWWRRRTKNVAYDEVLTPVVDTEYGDSLGLRVYSSSVVPGTIQYSSSIQFNSEGKATLNNPSNKTVSVSYAQKLGTELDDFKGKYISGCLKISTVTQDIFKIAENAEAYDWSGGGTTLFMFKQEYAYLVSSKQKYVYGDWEYVQSSSRSAYPDSGEKDGYEYQYLGVPFDNAVNSGIPGVQIETGSYVGTGTYGSSNPNSLTFGFAPKLVIIIDSYSFYVTFTLVKDCNKASVSSARSSGGINTVSWTFNSVEWYGTSSIDQLNNKGYIYQYLAIG